MSTTQYHTLHNSTTQYHTLNMPHCILHTIWHTGCCILATEHDTHHTLNVKLFKIVFFQKLILISMCRLYFYLAVRDIARRTQSEFLKSTAWMSSKVFKNIDKCSNFNSIFPSMTSHTERSTNVLKAQPMFSKDGTHKRLHWMPLDSKGHDVKLERCKW